MHPKKLESFVIMPPRERADYTIRRAADFEELWGLSLNDEFITEELDINGQQLGVFYVWPELEFAQTFMPLIHKEAGAKPKRIELDKFIEEYIPKMVWQHVRFSVFCGADKKSWIYTAKEMQEALEEELKQYM